MGDYDTTNADSDSTDLYSRVKLRALNKKVRHVANDVFAAEDGKSANARSRKFHSGIRQGVFSENVAAQLETLSSKNAFALENSRLRTLTEVIVKETNPYYAWRSENKRMNHQLADVRDFDMSDLLLDEGTAVEMLDALRRERPKNSSDKRLDIGDLVWGRVKSYPWWPGQIFDEALASPSVQSNKREGGTLVAFFGDYTYAWLAPTEIVPFDINFDENLMQTNVQTFLTGVEEALAEIKSRVALGLVCHCKKHSNVQPMMMEGHSDKQIQKARENFHPEEIIDFLKQVALSPRKIVKQNPYWIKNVANIFAFQKAVVKEFDETYAQDFKERHKSLECRTGITRENQKASQDAEAEVKTNCSTQITEVHYPQKKDGLNVRHGYLLTKHFEDHELQIKSEESKYIRQEGPYGLPKFSAKTRTVEPDIYSRGLVTKSDRSENLGDLPKDGNQHSSTVSDVQMICHQVKISPSNMFPVKNPGDASRNSCCSSKQLEEQNDLTNAGNKRKISGCLEEFGMERPARMNKLKSFGGFAANLKVLELQGERQAGIRSGSSAQPQKNSQIKRASIRRNVKERMLTIKFPSQTTLPSVSEVKAKFACFGPLDEHSTRFFSKSSTYQLVFQQKSDAEVAYHRAIQNSTLFSTSEVRYSLQASDHALNESGNSLELVENQEEIHSVSSLNGNEFAGELMSASFQPSLLLPEKIQLKSSLKKLLAESSDCPSIIESHSLENKTDNSEIPKNAVPLSLPSNFPLSSTTTCRTNEKFGIKQFVGEINMKHRQVEAMKNNDSQNTTIANNLDISHQLINLLTSCSGILGELKSSLEHMF